MDSYEDFPLNSSSFVSTFSS